MTYHRLPYDDAATPAQMASDCLVAERNLSLPSQRPTSLAALANQDVLGGTPPMSPSSPRLEVSDELAELAAGFSLHFD